MNSLKKLLILSFSYLFFVTGCSSKNDAEELAKTKYEGYYTSIEANESFIDSSLYYSISYEISALPDGSYRYYIFLDNAQVAMNDVILLAIENDVPYLDSNKMMPSIGIFDDTEYSLIPNQYDSDKGYVKGLVLSGESESDTVAIKLLVEWTGSNQKTNREFLSFTIGENDIEESTNE